MKVTWIGFEKNRIYAAYGEKVGFGLFCLQCERSLSGSHTSCIDVRLWELASLLFKHQTFHKNLTDVAELFRTRLTHRDAAVLSPSR